MGLSEKKDQNSMVLCPTFVFLTLNITKDPQHQNAYTQLSDALLPQQTLPLNVKKILINKHTKCWQLNRLERRLDPKFLKPRAAWEWGKSEIGGVTEC